MKKFIILIVCIFFSCLSVFSKETINVAFNIDNNYTTYLLLTLNSIFANNKSNSDYHFYVIENDLSNRNKNRIVEFIHKNNQTVDFVGIDKKLLDIGSSYYRNHPITNIAYARIFLPDLLPDLDKILYLDSDILVRSDLSELYNTNLGKYAMGMCIDYSYFNANIRNPKIRYYNDGVILMNLKLMRQYKLVNKMVDYTKEHPKLLYADQDVINKSVSNYIKTLDQKWNNQFYDGHSLKRDLNQGIIHYISHTKPWVTLPKKSCVQRYLYFQNWMNSPFKIYMLKVPYNAMKLQYKECLNKIIKDIKKELGYPNPNAENINVVFTIDNNYWIYTLLTINSILANNDSRSNYTFYIVENDLSAKNKKKMRNFVKKHHQNIEFINVDTSVVDNGENLYKKTRQHSYISRIAMARIFIPNLLPKTVHKAIYLDSDILVLTDLKELYDTKIDKYPVALAPDITEMKAVEMHSKIYYYNDGIIVMNLDYWRKNKITEKMVSYMLAKKSLPKMDQDLFNLILKGKIKILNTRWNNQYGLMNSKAKSIIHFVGPDKPWIYRAAPIGHIQSVYRNEYLNYWWHSSLVLYLVPYKMVQMYTQYANTAEACLIKIRLWSYRRAYD